ncbi:MAG: nucleotidyltransferase [Pseudomonadales bacterium]|nr:nucleotidyltransferase [Pseudomonadales bacterium]
MSIQKHFLAFHDRIKLSKQDDNYSDGRAKDDSITKAVKSAFNDSGYPVIEDFIQGSFSTDTAIISLDGDFDIDRGIVIDGDTAPTDAVAPKEVALGVLEKRGFTNAKIKTPCVTADYKTQNLHIDFPIYKKVGNTFYLAIGKKGSDSKNRFWDATDPKGLKDWIKDKSQYIGSSSEKQQQFNRLVRYSKRWRDYKFSSDVCRKVYSIGLTVMIKRCFVPVFDSDGKPCDLTAFRNTVSAILSYGFFVPQGNDQYRVKVNLPVMPNRDIFYGSSVDTGTQLRNKLTKLLEKLDAALEEGDEVKQCKILNWIFGDDFEIPEKDKSNSTAKKAVFSSSGSVGTSQGA